jgi:serine/threonine protein kinase
MRAGDRVLGYIVERELGEGGMGTVYLARHTVLDQQVAIKALSPVLARDEALRIRFIQEANIQAKLRHPGIVQVLTAEMEGEQPSLVMEYVDGKSLSEVLNLRGVLPVDDALKIMTQVLAAVGHAHKQGVIHRDLKPSNVMVMANGEAKVTDFGIAKVLGASKLTRTGTAMGSAHYMSPEQILNPEMVDARSDIYSLGCVFYEILSGRPPFGDKDTEGTDNDFKIKTAHVNETVPLLETVKTGIPEWLAFSVMHMLHKEPEQRSASCDAILEQINKADRIDGMGSDDPAGTSQDPRKEIQRTLVFLASAIVLIVCAWFFSGVRSQKTELSSADQITTSSPPENQTVETITRNADNVSRQVTAGNPNRLASCPGDQNLHYDNCWGTYTYANGDKYVGEWHEDQKHGLGTNIYATGDKYIGEFRNDSRNGQGTYIFANGRKEVGSFKDGLLHGLAIQYGADGTIAAFGIFENDQLVK